MSDWSFPFSQVRLMSSKGSDSKTQSASSETDCVSDITVGSFKTMVQRALKHYPDDPDNLRNNPYSEGYPLAFAALDVAYDSAKKQCKKCEECKECDPRPASSITQCPVCDENAGYDKAKNEFQSQLKKANDDLNTAKDDLKTANDALKTANKSLNDTKEDLETAKSGEGVKKYLKNFQSSFNCSDIVDKEGKSNWKDCDSRNRQVKCCINEKIKDKNDSSYDTAYKECKNFVENTDYSMAFGQLGGKSNKTAACLIQDSSLDPKPFQYIWNTVGPPSKQYADYHPFKSCVAKQSEIDRFMGKDEYKGNPKAAIAAAMGFCTQAAVDRAEKKNPGLGWQGTNIRDGQTLNTEDRCNNSYTNPQNSSMTGRCTWGVLSNTSENGNVKTGWYISGVPG